MEWFKCGCGKDAYDCCWFGEYNTDNDRWEYKGTWYCKDCIVGRNRYSYFRNITPGNIEEFAEQETALKK